MSEDSGQVHLTRDAGYRMIKHELDEFEEDVVDEIRKEVKRMTNAFERGVGAAWAIGIIFAIPEFIWVIMLITGKGK